MESTVVIKQPIEVVNELEALGLDADDLREAVRLADVFRGTLTPHHPTYFVGMAPQAETVKVLSDLLVPKGWVRRDINTSPRLVSPDGLVSIAVNSGDEWTGRPLANPRTRSAKGSTTQNDIKRNAEQYPLPMDVPVSYRPKRALPSVAELPAITPLSATTTWFLLFFAASDEVRCELSLPVSVDEDEHASEWRKRIILPSIPTEPGPRLRKSQDEVEFDVPVMRKTK
ncbi:MAG TPA: hypothetical protein VE057_24060 [Archangium sp.]|nr:hypothetical protein [Archangium sp.]